MRYRRPRDGASHSAVRYHLHRPRVHFGGGAPYAGGPGHRSRQVGVGDRDVHAVLLPVRDSHRGAGRSHRSAPRFDAGGAVVVRVHVPDRRSIELLPAPDHEVLLWRRRSGRVSERIHCRFALVPSVPAREHVRSAADGKPDWRSHGAAHGRADPDPLWVARILLCVRRTGNGLGGGLVRLVSRYAC